MNDFYHVNMLIGEEDRLIRDTVYDFVKKEFIPLIRDYHRAGKFPMEIVPKVAELGLLGATLPQEYGCAGINNLSYGLAMEALEYGDSGLRSFVSVQGGLVMYPIFKFGTEEQKRKFLPELASGEMIGCFGLTEHDFGSNPGGMRTTARKKGDSYILNGSKMWITNGSIADIAIIWAKLDNKIQGFIVETDRPGFFANEIRGKFSLRASVTSELVLEDCEIPEENILPGATGLKSALSCLTQARYSIAWGAIGAAKCCFDTARDYTISRKQFSRPIAGYQITQAKLTDMLTEIVKAELVAIHLARLKDSGKIKHYHVSLAKRNNVAIARDIARTAREMLGASGIVDDYPVIRHMLNMETVSTYEGTHDIHTLILGKEITGLEAFD